MRVEDIRGLSIFEGLTDDQLGQLLAGGDEVAIEPGRDLFHEGDHADHWWVLVDGVIELLRRVGREETPVGRLDVPGRSAGGFRAWDDQGVYLATARGVRPGRVLRVPADVLRDLTREWFPLGGHLIGGLYHTARSIESTARQRGSLVTLGTLAAGLAHELNNPASAAVRSVDGLEKACQTLLTSLSRLAADHISADQFRALDQLRREIDPVLADSDPLARADREQELSMWLSRAGIDRGWAVAPVLADAGVDVAWCERAAAVLDRSALEPGLEWVASTLSAIALLGQVKQSTRRVSELVAAVRSYSQMDRASMQEIDVVDGLESTLVMLGHKLRGVEVVRDFAAGLPRMDAYPGELNQVWTNLIDNASDAMDGRGTLRLSVHHDEGSNSIQVEIGDTGPGMPAEVADRAFEAFYTTKEVGKGTGLGLDIARRIVVERHGGVIAIERRSGETVFVIGLPVDAR